MIYKTWQIYNGEWSVARLGFLCRLGYEGFSVKLETKKKNNNMSD